MSSPFLFNEKLLRKYYKIEVIKSSIVKKPLEQLIHSAAKTAP
jgi:hypothetical protein